MVFHVPALHPINTLLTGQPATMNFAILGTDPLLLQLAQAARAAGHHFVWMGDIRPTEAGPLAAFVSSPADRAAEWELLLDRATVDGVFVGRGAATPEARAEQLKRLAAEAVPILATHPVLGSVIPYYEIDMARCESRGVIQHYHPVMNDPLVSQLAAWVEHGHPQAGRISQLTCERAARGTSREHVLAWLARDIELIAQIAGHIRRVNAVGPAVTDPSFASLQTLMTSANLPALRWSVGVVSSQGERLELKLLGDQGTIVLVGHSALPAEPTRWELELMNEGGRTQLPVPSFDPAAQAVERFLQAITDPDVESRSARSTWDSAIRSMEVVDCVELSLVKGRTIEVVQQQLTEQLAFRGTMSAFGCGLLMLAFLSVVAVALLGGAEGLIGQKIAPAWPVLMLAILASFLILQAVPFLLANTRRTGQDTRETRHGTRR